MSKISNFLIFYRRNWAAVKLSTGLQFYSNDFRLPQMHQSQNGLSINISRDFLQKKLKGSIICSSARNIQENQLNNTEKSGNLTQIRSQWSWQVSSAHQIRLDASLMSNRGENIQPFSETRFRFHYVAILNSTKQ